MVGDIIQDNIKLINESILLVEKRFSEIKNSKEFVSSDSGILILDAISMRLQVIGELLKKIKKLDKSFLEQYTQINWSNIMRLRDIVSHHYEHVDHEIIYDICKNHIPKLKNVLSEIIARF